MAGGEAAKRFVLLAKIAVTGSLSCFDVYSDYAVLSSLRNDPVWYKMSLAIVVVAAAATAWLVFRLVHGKERVLYTVCSLVQAHWFLLFGSALNGSRYAEQRMIAFESGALLEVVLESVPQLLLQTYIIIKQQLILVPTTTTPYTGNSTTTTATTILLSPTPTQTSAFNNSSSNGTSTTTSSLATDPSSYVFQLVCIALSLAAAGKTIAMSTLKGAQYGMRSPDAHPEATYAVRPLTAVALILFSYTDLVMHAAVLVAAAVVLELKFFYIVAAMLVLRFIHSIAQGRSSGGQHAMARLLTAAQSSIAQLVRGYWANTFMELVMLVEGAVVLYMCHDTAKSEQGRYPVDVTVILAGIVAVVGVRYALALLLRLMRHMDWALRLISSGKTAEESVTDDAEAQPAKEETVEVEASAPV